MPTDYRILRLDAKDERPPFVCEDNELTEFFHEQSIEYCNELLAVTYVLYDGDVTVAYYCVSNDALRKEDVKVRSRLKRILKPIPHAKRTKSTPAVKIGRLAVAEGLTGQNVGSTLLDRIKYDFTHSNKTGCRYIIVDAYNNPKTIRFYQKNEFDFIDENDKEMDTRIMFFDLKRFPKS